MSMKEDLEGFVEQFHRKNPHNNCVHSFTTLHLHWNGLAAIFEGKGTRIRAEDYGGI